jgi:hypothetical protein
MKLQKLALPFASAALAATAIGAFCLPGVTASAATTTTTTPVTGSPPAQPLFGPGSNTPCNFTTSSVQVSVNGNGQTITTVYPTGLAATSIMGGTCSDSNRPVVAVVHGLFAGSASLYQGVIDHEASIGNIVIFATYDTNPLDFNTSFGQEQTEIAMGVKSLTRDDPSRFGIIGHSMGAGAVPFLTEQAAAAGWGKNALFAYSLAPWEIADVPSGNFTFPGNTRLIVENFDTDVFVSASMGSDLYSRANIPASQKTHITLHSETLDGVRVSAVHVLVNSIIYPNNVMKFYGIYRNADLLQSCSDQNSLCNFSAMSNMGNWSTGQAFTPATVANS